MTKNIVLNSKQFENIITRLSYEIIEKNEDFEKLCLVGIRSRGDVISERIVEKINSIKNCNLKNGYIDVTFYRDDFMSNLGTHKIGPSNIRFDVNDKKLSWLMMFCILVAQLELLWMKSFHMGDQV